MEVVIHFIQSCSIEIVRARCGRTPLRGLLQKSIMGKILGHKQKIIEDELEKSLSSGWT